MSTSFCLWYIILVVNIFELKRATDYILRVTWSSTIRWITVQPKWDMRKDKRCINQMTSSFKSNHRHCCQSRSKDTLKRGTNRGKFRRFGSLFGDGREKACHKRAFGNTQQVLVFRNHVVFVFVQKLVRLVLNLEVEGIIDAIRVLQRPTVHWMLHRFSEHTSPA